MIPYGSQVMINGVVYTAEDRGGAVKSNHIDIFFDTHGEAIAHGVRYESVIWCSADLSGPALGVRLQQKLAEYIITDIDAEFTEAHTGAFHHNQVVGLQFF